MTGETQFFLCGAPRLRWTLVASTCPPIRTACAAEIETFDGSLSYSGRYRGLPWGVPDVKERWTTGATVARGNHHHQISLLAVDSVYVNTLIHYL